MKSHQKNILCEFYRCLYKNFHHLQPPQQWFQILFFESLYIDRALIFQTYYIYSVIIEPKFVLWLALVKFVSKVYLFIRGMATVSHILSERTVSFKMTWVERARIQGCGARQCMPNTEDEQWGLKLKQKLLYPIQK